MWQSVKFPLLHSCWNAGCACCKGLDTHLPRMRDSPISTHSRELRASKLEFSNSFMATEREHNDS